MIVLISVAVCVFDSCLVKKSYFCDVVALYM